VQCLYGWSVWSFVDVGRMWPRASNKFFYGFLLRKNFIWSSACRFQEGQLKSSKGKIGLEILRNESKCNLGSTDPGVSAKKTQLTADLSCSDTYPLLSIINLKPSNLIPKTDKSSSLKNALLFCVTITSTLNPESEKNLIKACASPNFLYSSEFYM